MKQWPLATISETVRIADRLLALGAYLPDVCKALQVDEDTLMNWRQEYRHFAESPPKKKFWLFEIWDEHRETFKALIAHTLIFSLLLGLLVLSHIVINHLDYPPERKELFDKIHYAGYVAVLIVFLISFIVKLVAFEYRGLKK